MLFIIPAILVLGFLLWLFTRPDSGSSPYEKSRNFMDFDPGKDGKKVGDPKYPTAGVDSEMKQQFLNDLLDGNK